MRTFMIVGALLWAAASASAQTRSVYIEDLTWYEIRDAMAAGKTAAILYAGGTEQNGPHMSLAKHNLIARHVAGQIAERLGNALVYPVMPFSPAGDATEKTGHMRFPGTVIAELGGVPGRDAAGGAERRRRRVQAGLPDG